MSCGNRRPNRHQGFGKIRCLGAIRSQGGARVCQEIESQTGEQAKSLSRRTRMRAEWLGAESLRSIGIELRAFSPTRMRLSIDATKEVWASLNSLELRWRATCPS